MEVNNLFAFGRVNLGRVLHQFDRIGSLVRLFFGIGLAGSLDVVFCKILLRSSATGSTRAMIAPIKFWHGLVSRF